MKRTVSTMCTFPSSQQTTGGALSLLLSRTENATSPTTRGGVTVWYLAPLCTMCAPFPA